MQLSNTKIKYSLFTKKKAKESEIEIEITNTGTDLQMLQRLPCHDFFVTFM
jgi:hypothetical protein